MRILIDTHYLLWWLDDAPELGERAKEIISEPTNIIFFSAASLWELRIKEGIGKVDLPASFSDVLAQQAFEPLSVTAKHADALRGLPMHHRDPFDRLLVAQARVEGLTFLTRDKIIGLYDVDSIIL